MATTYGWITGRVIQPIGDTETDVDRTPADRPSAGDVILTPLVAATTGSALVARDSIRRPLDADGWIVDLDGVAAVAVPVGSYRVEWALASGRWPAQDIAVTAEHTKDAPYDIGEQSPVQPVPGTPMTLLEVPSGAFDGGFLGWGGGLVWLPGTGGTGSVVGVTATDTPAAPPEGESASYLVTSAVVWPAGLVWSTDPDGGIAPTITGTALVSMFTLGGITRAIMGATFPTPPAPADVTDPSIPAGLSATAASSTSVTLAWSASTDDTAVTGYEYRVGGGTAVDAGAGLTETVTGLTASTLYSFEVRAYDAAGNRSDWSTAASATTSAPPADSTPPTVGTMAASSITATGFTLTVSGASDAVALHATPYAFTTNGGTTWSAYQASPVYVASGLTASTGYSCNWRVRDAAGNVATGTAQTVTTGAAAPPAEGLAGAILALSPSGYWKLDETSGTQAIDYSGNARHGTYAGTYTLAGADGYLSAAAAATVTIPDADAFSALPALSIFAVYKSSNNTGRVMDKAGAQFEHKLGFATTGRLELAVWSTAGNNAPAFVRGSTIATGSGLPWQTAAATIPDPQLQTSTLHRAGVAETPDRAAAGVGVYGNTTVPLTLARNLTGALAHVAIFPTALTAGQIEALHAAAVADPTVPVTA